MSIVTLKRKGQQLRTLSGKTPNAIMVVAGPDQQEPLTTGGGFTLNGKERNIGYIGRNSMNSIGGSRMRSGTTDWKGTGGRSGAYPINPSANNQCCVKNIGVKPSVLNPLTISWIRKHNVFCPKFSLVGISGLEY